MFTERFEKYLQDCIYIISPCTELPLMQVEKANINSAKNAVSMLVHFHNSISKQFPNGLKVFTDLDMLHWTYTRAGRLTSYKLIDHYI